MGYIKLFEEFNSSGDEVRMMAWLYFLKNPYKGELPISEWKNDRRMDGMKAGDAMSKLEKLGYATTKGKAWKITSKGIKAADDFFLKTSKEAAEAYAKTLTQFDHPKDLYAYPMSRIPIYYWTDYSKSLRKYKSSDTLNWNDYDFLKTFIEKYERDMVHDLSKLKKYVGKVDELCENNDYVLFRGINIPHSELNKIKVGDKYKGGNQEVQSWTTKKSIAVQFSLGNPTPMQVTIDNNRFKDRFGVVLKHTFPAKQVILDLVYISEMNPELLGSMQFDEEEVIVLAGKGEFEVIEIHNEQGDPRPHF